MTRLELLRRLRGLSQRDLAEAINVAQPTISYFESGMRQQARPKTKTKLEELFGEPFEDLIRPAA